MYSHQPSGEYINAANALETRTNICLTVGGKNQYRSSGSGGAVPILDISLFFHLPSTIKGHFCRVFLNDKNPTEVELRDLLSGRRIRGIKWMK